MSARRTEMTGGASAGLALALTVACLLSAIALVYTRHESRKLFVELQRHSVERDALNIDWGRLQIEQSTYATHGRIERLAREELALGAPDTGDIYVVERR